MGRHVYIVYRSGRKREKSRGSEICSSQKNLLHTYIEPDLVPVENYGDKEEDEREGHPTRLAHLASHQTALNLQTEQIEK